VGDGARSARPAVRPDPRRLGHRRPATENRPSSTPGSRTSARAFARIRAPSTCRSPGLHRSLARGACAAIARPGAFGAACGVPAATASVRQGEGAWGGGVGIPGSGRRGRAKPSAFTRAFRRRRAHAAAISVPRDTFDATQDSAPRSVESRPPLAALSPRSGTRAGRVRNAVACLRLTVSLVVRAPGPSRAPNAECADAGLPRVVNSVEWLWRGAVARAVAAGGGQGRTPERAPAASGESPTTVLGHAIAPLSAGSHIRPVGDPTRPSYRCSVRGG
jgi:hypothetical protein